MTPIRITILLIIIMQTSLTISAQRTVDALLLMKGSKDTMEVKIIVKNNLFYKTYFDPMSLHKNIIIVGEEKDIWLKEKNIDYISFIDFEGDNREFISINKKPELKQIDSVNKKLYEIICKGKIRWYRVYYPHGLDYSAMGSDYLVKDNMKPISLTLFTNMKKKLLKLTKDMPEFEAKINEVESVNDMLEIVKLYNNN